MLSREEFDLVIAERIGLYIPHEGKNRVKVEQMDVMKNNDTHLRGISISPSDGNVAVTIYLDEFYQRYLCGVGCGEIMEQIAELYEQRKPVQKQEFKSADFEYGAIKDKVTFRVVDMKKNQQTLRQIPYHELGNGMAMIYTVILDTKEESIASVIINREMAQRNGYNLEQLRKDAISNTPLLFPPVLMNLKTLINKKIDQEAPDCHQCCVSLDLAEENPERVSMHLPTEDLFTEEMQMFVLTNENSNMGAGVLYYPGVQERLARVVGGSYYVLPSSVHEQIILPDNKEISPKELEAMVKEINETQVEPQEVLSDRVLRYDHVTKELYRPLDRVQDKSMNKQETEREER